MSKHTPTPWTFAKTHAEDFSICSARTSIFNHIASIPVFNGMAHSGASVPCESDRAEANAAFIVQACNAYDDLVAALRDMVRYEDLPEADQQPAVERARAALAKAGAA